MLTKDLLKFRRRGDYIKPVFIGTVDPMLLELAEKLLAVYSFEQDSGGMTRGEISELVEPVLKSVSDPKISRGLNKLIQDRCIFEQPAEYDYAEMRRQVFRRSAELLKQHTEFETYRETILNDPENGDFVRQDIFADLPENEHLVKLKPMFPRELLERYNCAQVQSLLIYADEMEIKVADDRQAEMRRLFKYLKFFRLLADIEQLKPSSSEKGFLKMRLSVSGPASLLENTRKYGLQLASFFPAVCAMRKWSLKADVKLKDKRYRLILDESSGLVSHYRNFSAYVPEEIAMFHRLFKQKVEDWKIVGDTPFIKGQGQEIIFPDLSFCDSAGQVMHLELFHRWHYGSLLKRLEFCEKNMDLPLLLGVDRSLLNNAELKTLLDAHPYFSERGFLFRDFPGVDRVHKMLSAVSENSA
jgi:predicted nuclease of restriction endonuclease-like RecB superfamily